MLLYFINSGRTFIRLVRNHELALHLLSRMYFVCKHDIYGQCTAYMTLCSCWIYFAMIIDVIKLSILYYM